MLDLQGGPRSGVGQRSWGFWHSPPREGLESEVDLMKMAATQSLTPIQTWVWVLEEFDIYKVWRELFKKESTKL